MGRYQRIFLLLLALGLFLTPQVWAARIQMGSDSLSGKTGDDHGIAVSLTVKEGDYEGANPSQNEKAEFVVDSPRDGDRCVTNPSSSDSTGKVTGTCYASKAGSVKVYAKSTDRGDQSESVTLEFSEPDSTDDKPKDDADPADETAPQDSPTAADEAKKAAAMKAYQEQMAQGQGGGGQQTAGSALASQLGLTEDKNTGMGDGLANGGSVAGASSGNENNPRSDLDLLNSIIYLAGGIIFIIAALYFIWWQMKEHQARMEKKKNGGGNSDGTPDTTDTKTDSPTDTTKTPTEIIADKKESVPTPTYDPTAGSKSSQPADATKPKAPETEPTPTPITQPTAKTAEPKAPLKKDEPLAKSPEPETNTTTSLPPEASKASDSRPTLAQLRSATPAQAPAQSATTQSVSAQPTASKPEPTDTPANAQPTTPAEPDYTVDAIARRITQEIQKSKSEQ